jgi:tetratricopeptide (TPR) repeat protein
MKMRGLLLVLLFVIPFSVSAQSLAALQNFEQGVKASRSGSHAAALQSFTDTLALIEREGATEKFFAKVHYNLGVSNYSLRRLEPAALEYEKAERFSKGSYEKAAYALGLVESERGKWSDAKKAFRRAIVQNGRNGGAWFDLAFVYLATGENAKARKAFLKAIVHGSRERAASHNNIGVLLAIEGKYPEAIAEFEAAMAVNANFEPAVANLKKCRNMGTYKNEPITANELKYANRRSTAEKG